MGPISPFKGLLARLVTQWPCCMLKLQSLTEPRSPKSGWDMLRPRESYCWWFRNPANQWIRYPTIYNQMVDLLDGDVLWFRNPVNSPVEGQVVYPISYKVLAPSQVGFRRISEPSTVSSRETSLSKGTWKKKQLKSNCTNSFQTDSLHTSSWIITPQIKSVTRKEKYYINHIS